MAIVDILAGEDEEGEEEKKDGGEIPRRGLSDLLSHGSFLGLVSFILRAIRRLPPSGIGSSNEDDIAVQW